MLRSEVAWFLESTQSSWRGGGLARSAGLTAREREVLEQLARGIDNAAIATRMGLTPKTVRNYVSSLFDKLGVATRAEAIVAAREAGFGTGR